MSSGVIEEAQRTGRDSGGSLFGSGDCICSSVETKLCSLSDEHDIDECERE
jgi:hypothetical protein